MMFSENLHPVLRFLLNDKAIGPQVAHYLKLIDESSDASAAMSSLNKLLFESGLMNVVFEFRFFYATKTPKILKKLPLAVQVPYPWQVFETSAGR